jgi:hypothetical protein
MSQSQRLMRTLSALTFFCVLGVMTSEQASADGSVSALRKPSGQPMGMGAKPHEMSLFDEVVEKYNASGERFRIDSHCQSACTIFLSIRNVCITPNATLLFHVGGDRHAAKMSAGSTAHMLGAYNSALRQYVTEHHFMDTFEFHTISGRDMISRFGYPACR